MFAPLSFLWQLLNQFLLSPWGLIVPMTLLTALFAAHKLQQTPAHIAQFYAEQLETASRAELPQLLDALVRMGDAGVPGLVHGLTSQREAVFTASLNVLQREFDRWQESDRREHHFRILSEAILQACNQFSPAAQAEAMRFVDQMMQIRPIAATSPESTADRQATIANCERILSQLESMRRRRIEPQDGEFAPQSDTIAALNRRTHQPVLLASDGQPFMPTSARQDRGDETHLADADSFNPFSVARADRLLAHQAHQRSLHNQTLQSQPAGEVADGRWQFAADASGAVTPLPPSAVSGLPSLPADIESRIAQHFAASDVGQFSTADISDISEEFRNRIQSESGGVFGSDSFLTPELLNTPLDRVPNLLTSQLMQLLHHPDPSYVETAQRTLVSRDGFQEQHLRLAWRLYHPIPAVRQEIVAMLPHTSNVQPSVWLTVLLDDPNNDVRFRTASFLATTSDPALQRLLIDRGRQDGDPRITSLATRLDETQRGTVRR